MIGRSEAIARLNHVTHLYGKIAALGAVTLTLPVRCTVGLIGPDGVGKSSLLGIIAGARQIQSGKVCVLDGDMAEAAHRAALCPRIAYMPQGLGKNLYPDLSVRENIEYFSRLFGQSRSEREQRIAELLAGTGLAPFADRPTKKLSGGMRQKLGLCCSLIHDPDLLILDEPTTGVDPLSRRQFWELIDQIRSRRQAMSILVATAYMEEAERFDWLVAMSAGEILATGTPAELKAQTGTQSLEGAFIALLPEQQRTGHRELQTPSRSIIDTEPVIAARGLTCRFGDFTAVDHVSFTIERGEIFGFVGSNGCGKTTTMKVLTGLLPASGGEALLFGRPVDASDLRSRNRVGYMSQSFSLYTELTVRQNLNLHARLFHLPIRKARVRIAELIDRFGLTDYVDQRAVNLPLGIRQRLSLAVAVVHEPEVLILDEPTSGVDPLARDRFWELLIDLSRNQSVTIFVSTHFMNEAERCDRISLMDSGRVLATNTPAGLVEARGVATLEEAFISHLEEASKAASVATIAETALEAPQRSGADPVERSFSVQRLLACTIRESLELLRDPIRLGFALLGTTFLMLVFGFGISTDVNNLSFAVLDRDQSHESRAYLEEMRGSPYFLEKSALADYSDLEKRLENANISAGIEIPPGFGRDIARGRHVWVAAWVDGARPFVAQTIRGYLQGMHQLYLGDPAVKTSRGTSSPPADIAIRFKYNQDFDSIYAMVPSTMALELALFPAILMALAIVREKELGSITNLYVTPVTRVEFLVGKQLPYVAVAMVNFALMFVMALLVFNVPLKGSFLTLLLGTLIYVGATTAYGMLISAFARTQIAALFGTAILTVLPATMFAGMMVPVSSLSGTAQIMGRLFPMTYFPAGQCRHLHERPRVLRPRSQAGRARGLHPCAHHAEPAAAEEAGTLGQGHSMRALANIFWLGTKELRSLLNDFVLLGLVIYAFSLAIIAQAQSSSQEVHNASIAIVDEDNSELSRRIAHAFLPPYFQTPQPIAERDIVPLMNSGRYTFVIDVPPNFQRDVLGRRQPAIQLDVDATAMVQAGLGADYAQQIIMTEIIDFLSRREGNPVSPVNLVVRIAFNPNVITAWFTSVMGIINDITMLAIILAGAAVVREREHGTMDHLLVMPLTPFEIAMSKIWANSLVIVVAVGLSLEFVVHGLLNVPIAGSIPLFLTGAAIYLFFATAIGIFLGTIARSMPQLGLLYLLVFLPLNMLSGSNTPLESMPSWLAMIMRASPSTHFVSLAQAILYRGAGFAVVWPQFVIVALIGGVFLCLALRRFRKVSSAA